MDKTERLFAVMDALRRHRRPVTAAALAEEQGVSLRTLYRDVRTLIGLGAPIVGEAGVGYMLKPGFFLPPLMFTAEELEALVLGSRWVEAQPDAGLAGAARNALAKIATASPEDLRDRMNDTGLWPILMRGGAAPLPVLGLVRRAIREEKALLLVYADEKGQPSQREIWPVQLAFHEGKQLVAAWCCLRQAFRHFRVDRITAASATEARYGRPRSVLAREWREEWERLYPD
ncbi:Predicted DNA-binding transcriptional regulator YafY, contains an HTH and WYL domains [Myxococcus fulvus]|uniref:DeoR family transcriptional regulator n=1 Tax=Myxococcus fulvus TaxID=33 RepID=A0A511TGV7_MYXFU|nr:YafY family protein [Myxococcus fulvus]GEN13381.1 DeoR family transcriptional regulator [Myxococcus fulvus]SEU42703.1 Predicted DNA-binding transcriptional regulator YafY, contains an HTH and WYL domains [Myxococcus fulvus]